MVSAGVSEMVSPRTGRILFAVVFVPLLVGAAVLFAGSGVPEVVSWVLLMVGSLWVALTLSHEVRVLTGVTTALLVLLVVGMLVPLGLLSELAHLEGVWLVTAVMAGTLVSAVFSRGRSHSDR